jgi:tRNA pseudouridine55 synthase
VGVVNVRKVRGWTSHDVVARLRRLSGQRRIGHAGTLDPMAEGVLPVLFGRATRLVEQVQAGEKQYRAEVQLGTATATDDAEGEIVQGAPVPPLDVTTLECALGAFRGTIQQVPPAYSAVKVQGQRAYAVARKGGLVTLAPREVMIHALHGRLCAPDVLELDVTCSSGTYVRALARDLARRLGTVGHLRLLERTRVGPFLLEDAQTLDEIAMRGVASVLLPPDAALPDTVRYAADGYELARLARGQAICMPETPSATFTSPSGPHIVRVYDGDERMQFVARADGPWLRAQVTLYPDVAERLARTAPNVEEA